MGQIRSLGTVVCISKLKVKQKLWKSKMHHKKKRPSRRMVGQQLWKGMLFSVVDYVIDTTTSSLSRNVAAEEEARHNLDLKCVTREFRCKNNQFNYDPT